MANVVIITKAVYRNKAVEGIFVMTQDYTAWNGDTRRIGNGGQGYVKVKMEDWVKPVKVTVPGEGIGYTVVSGARAEVVAEIKAAIDTHTADMEAATGAERSKFRKRLRRAEAKLEAALSE